MDAEILRRIVKELLNNISAQDVERIEVNKINNRTVIFIQLINEEEWNTLEEYLQQNCIGENSFFGYEFKTKEACIIASATGYRDRFQAYYPKENMIYINGKTKIKFNKTA